MIQKTCCVCQISKPLIEFGIHSSRRDGRQTYCKVCAKSEQTRWYYQRKHGISLDERDYLLEQQNGKCAICGLEINFSVSGRGSKTGEDAVLDHCHESKELRGVLCGHCNTGLGAFKDSPDTLYNAIEYLIKFEQ